MFNVSVHALRIAGLYQQAKNEPKTKDERNDKNETSVCQFVSAESQRLMHKHGAAMLPGHQNSPRCLVPRSERGQASKLGPEESAMQREPCDSSNSVYVIYVIM